MKTKIIGLGVGLAAIATGAMFCGDPDITGPEPDDLNATSPEPTATDNVAPPAKLAAELQFAEQGHALPVFWAVRTGDAWRRPPLNDGKLKLSLPDKQASYGVVTICETNDGEGQQTFHTRIVEATVGEMSKLALICPAADPGQLIQVSGAIRNVNGQAATLTVGTQTTVVENPKNAKDVAFSADVPAGTQTIVATIGTGEKQSFATVTLDIEEGVAVELDASSATTLAAKTLTMSLVDTIAVGGSAALWFGGGSRVEAGPMEWGSDEPTLGLRSSNAANDFLDVRTMFRSNEPGGLQSPPGASARFIVKADREEPLFLPYLTWVAPTYASVSHRHVEFAWSTANWAVFGPRGDELAFYAPIAYVGSAEVGGTVSHRLDVVVTPNRVRGQHAMYTVPTLDEIDGFDGRWTFPAGRDDVHASSGNLSALAGKGAADPGRAVAAYLDRSGDRSPADLGVEDSLSIIVAGAPVVTVTPDTSLADKLQGQCDQQRPCALKIEQDVMAVKMCPDLAIYNDCRRKGADSFSVEPSDFVDDLKREIARWYAAGAMIPNALPLEEALGNISVEGVHQVTDRTADEWWVYNPETYQVFWHIDPTRIDSKAVWYGAYLAGRLVSIHAVNWDGRLVK